MLVVLIEMAIDFDTICSSNINEIKFIENCKIVNYQNNLIKYLILYTSMYKLV